MAVVYNIDNCPDGLFQTDNPVIKNKLLEFEEVFHEEKVKDRTLAAEIMAEAMRTKSRGW